MVTKIQFINREKNFGLLESYWCKVESMNGDAVSFEKLFDTEFNEPMVELNQDGLLCLVENKKCCNLLERFWLVLFNFENGPSIHIPFANGSADMNRNSWKIEDRPLVAQVIRQVDTGFLVSVEDEPGFLPFSVLKRQRIDFTEIEGKFFGCDIIAADGIHPVVVSPTSQPTYDRGPLHKSI